jgi:hypothetical protein
MIIHDYRCRVRYAHQYKVLVFLCVGRTLRVFLRKSFPYLRISKSPCFYQIFPDLARILTYKGGLFLKDIGMLKLLSL